MPRTFALGYVSPTKQVSTRTDNYQPTRRLTLNCPYSGTGPKVEYLVWIIEGREMKFLAQHFDHRVFHILAFLLNIVVREVVSPFSELMLLPSPTRSQHHRRLIDYQLR